MAKRKIETIRGCLERNKIFIEIVGGAILSACTIVLSYQLNQLTSQSNRIYEKQNEIMRLQNLPIIHLARFCDKDPVTQRYAYERVIITNNGQPLSNFHVTNAEFFFVRREGSHPQEQLVAVNDFYGDTIDSGNDKGELATLLNGDLKEGNWERASVIIHAFDAIPKARENYCFIEFRRYFCVSYDDMSGESHVDYFQLDDVYGKRRLPSNEGEAIFAKYRSSPRIELRDATAEGIFEKCHSLIMPPPK